MKNLRSAVAAVVLLALCLPPGTLRAGAVAAGKITHRAHGPYLPGFRITVSARVEGVDVKEVRCYFRTRETEDFHYVSLLPKGEGEYEGSLPAPWVGSAAIVYRLRALTGEGTFLESFTYETKEDGTKEQALWVKLLAAASLEEDESRREGLERDLEKRVRASLLGNYAEKIRPWQTQPDGNPIEVYNEDSVLVPHVAGFRDRVGAAADGREGAAEAAVVIEEGDPSPKKSPEGSPEENANKSAKKSGMRSATWPALIGVALGAGGYALSGLGGGDESGGGSFECSLDDYAGTWSGSVDWNTGGGVVGSDVLRLDFARNGNILIAEDRETRAVVTPSNCIFTVTVTTRIVNPRCSSTGLSGTGSLSEDRRSLSFRVEGSSCGDTTSARFLLSR